MNVLVDTQSAIWFALNNPRLSRIARETIEDETNECHVSMAMFWEMSIKINLGKLDMAGLTLAEFMDKMDEHKFLTLFISREHILENERLLFLPKHRDPFDRLIISQAIFEQMPIVSNDPDFDNYPIRRIW
jgi:PIN domain nuclease of toxin-antitoxin system